MKIIKKYEQSPSWKTKSVNLSSYAGRIFYDSTNTCFIYYSIL